MHDSKYKSKLKKKEKKTATTTTTTAKKTATLKSMERKKVRNLQKKSKTIFFFVVVAFRCAFEMNIRRVRQLLLAKEKEIHGEMACIEAKKKERNKLKSFIQHLNK